MAEYPDLKCYLQANFKDFLPKKYRHSLITNMMAAVAVVLVTGGKINSKK